MSDLCDKERPCADESKDVKRSLPDGRTSAATSATPDEGPKQWTLRQIQCLVVLADSLHFGRGAERMHMTQPAFSRQIKALEESLGLHLVNRSKQRVNLTPAGTTFVEGCNDALTALRNAVARARLIEGGFAGRLAIGYTDFAISGRLPEFLCTFKHRYPDLILEPAQGSTHDLLGGLRDGRLDIVFVTGPVVEEGLEAVVISHHRILAVLYGSHPLAREKALTLSDLAEEPFVFGSRKHWQHFLRHIDWIFMSAGIQPKIVETAYNSEGLFGLIAGKLGITLYPDCVRNYHRTGLVLREFDDLNAVVPTVAVWRRDDASKALCHCRDLLLAYLRDTN